MDARSDLFSLGCVLYEAATGRLPFRGANALTVMHQILTAHPPAPGTLRATLPLAFDRLVAACLEKDPARRPRSAADVAQSLRALSASPDGITAERESMRTRAGRRSVAVMPFRFRTAQPEDRFLSLALAEAVTNRLAAASELVVRPVASVLRYDGTDVEWTEVARDLNVDHVVEGTIQKMGAKIRVLVQAVQVNDSRPLVSFRQDGDMDDLFSLQDRIADSVSAAFLPGTNAGAEPAVPPTKNPLAYELYMRAAERVVHMNKFDTGSAIEMLSRVVEIDPGFADAWGHLAYACAQMGMHLDPDPQWFDRAEQAIAKTLELDPVQCDALCARGLILWSPARGFQNLPALRAMNAALKIHPGSYNYRQFRGAILFHLGFYEQAGHDMRESILANPAYVLAITSAAVIEQYKGNYAAARELFLHSLAKDPTLMHTNIFLPQNLLAMGRLEEARDMILKARQIIPEESMVTSLEGLLAACEGDFARAEQLADDACSASGKSMTHTHHTWHCAAGAYTLCGKPEKAISQLRHCARMGLPNYRMFAVDPHLKGLRDESEFLALMSDLRREFDQYRAVVDPIG
jgi:TolB-like protein/tetratricopeptide (TPR) repeat protein